MNNLANEQARVANPNAAATSSKPYLFDLKPKANSAGHSSDDKEHPTKKQKF